MNSTRYLAFFFVVPFFLLAFAIAAEARQKILVIQSYHPTLSWTKQCDKAIVDTLEKSYDIKFYHIDTKRIDSLQIQRNVNEAHSLFLQYSPDVVMLGDDNALRLLGKYILNYGTPLVYFGINNNPRNYFNELPENFTGVLERTPIFPAARVFRSLLPESKKVLFLFDKSQTTRSIISVTFNKEKHFKLGNMFLEYKIASNWEEWKNIIKNNHEYDMIIIPTFHNIKDHSGTHISIKKIIQWTSHNSEVPVFSCQEYTVGREGTVGAYTLYGYFHGQLAAQIARKILSGEKPKSISPQTDRNGRLYLNKEQAEKYNISVPDHLEENVVYK